MHHSSQASELAMTKRALIVGINSYKNPNFSLRGCLNDVNNLYDVLSTKYGFSGQNIVVLKDAQATQQGILAEINKLFSAVAAGDIVVFGYSGHGVQHTKPNDSAVLEAIVPYETESTASIISNKDINLIARRAFVAKNLSGKANFTAIYDCCHSGKMFRDIGVNIEGVFEATVVNRVIDISRLLPPPGIRTRDLELNDDFQMFSACRDEQTAADLASRPAKNVMEPRGAFSFVLHELMRANPAVSINELEQKLLDPIKDLVSPHIQVPVFAVQEAWKNKPILTI
jgi:hypothetical protein